MHRATAIQAGDFERTAWADPQDDTLDLYQGSGRAGACWNRWGLMNTEDAEQRQPGKNRTVWMHADHWHRGNHGTDAWLPLGRLTWAGDTPAIPNFYRQKLSLCDGRLTTTAAGPDGSYTLCSYFDPGRPDALTLEIEYDFPTGQFPSLIFQPCLSVDLGSIGHCEISVRRLHEQANPPWSLLALETGTVRTLVGLRVTDLEGSSQLRSTPRGIVLDFARGRGRHILWLGASNEGRQAELVGLLQNADPKTWAVEASAHWEKRWGRGWIQIPDRAGQALWARSHYHLLSSYGADVRSPAPPMGWSGNNWPYHFPQDLSYVQPALLRLGHLDIAKAWIEFYHRTIPSMQEATSRIFNARGVMWAWGYPIGENSRIMSDGAPNRYAYQIHNAAYPARMAFETAQYLGDANWTREIAWNVVRESARFFASLLTRGRNGKWELCVQPSSGQDEFDEDVHQNYLCSLFSAQYALQAGVRMAVSLGMLDDEISSWQRVLADGLPFARLLDPAKKIYATAEGLDMEKRYGRQKHPVQLNPLVFLPLGPADEPTMRAYRQRHELCIGHAAGDYAGWTLPAFWLAAAHVGDAESLRADLKMGKTTCHIDADSLQIYESAQARCPYFMTSSGLYCQAVQDVLVHDYWGKSEFGAACPAAWTDVAFGGLHTADGNIWDGSRTGGSTWKINEPAPRPPAVP